MHVQNGTSSNGTSTKRHKLKTAQNIPAYAINGRRHKTAQAQNGTWQKMAYVTTRHTAQNGIWHKTAHDIYIDIAWEIQC
jgi:hypothetical protein